MNSSNDIKGIIFFDLDGTLLDNSVDEIPASTLKAIDELRTRGYKIIISTGRDMDTHYSSKYVDIVKPDAIIHVNGNKITIDGKMVFKHVMDEQLLRRVVDFSREHNLCIGTSVGKEDFYINNDKKIAADSVYNKFINRNFVDIEELFKRDIEVCALSFAGDTEKEGRILEKYFPTLKLCTFSTNTGADIIEEGCSKADGMYKVCDYFDVPYDRTYAFGDSMNDVHILRAAKVGIAMGNAEQRVKDAADYVTTGIADDGIYNACVNLGLIEG